MRAGYLALIVLVGCGTEDEIRTPPESLSACRGIDADAIDVTGLLQYAETDQLDVDLQYYGGCETHTFVLCWPSQTFIDGQPAQAQLEVWHDAAGDTCTDLVADSLRVDLAPLRQAWQALYQKEKGAILLKVHDQDVRYPFD